jgi:hypothetical protein
LPSHGARERASKGDLRTSRLRGVNVDGTFWLFTGLLGFGVINLVAAAVFLKRGKRTQSPAAPVHGRLNTGQTLDVLALSLILVALMAVVILDVLLVLPSSPAIGRLALLVMGAIITRVLGRLFALLPNTPRWVPPFLRAFEVALLVLAVVGLLLTLLLRPAGS